MFLGKLHLLFPYIFLHHLFPATYAPLRSKNVSPLHESGRKCLYSLAVRPFRPSGEYHAITCGFIIYLPLILSVFLPILHLLFSLHFLSFVYFKVRLSICLYGQYLMTDRYLLLIYSLFLPKLHLLFPYIFYHHLFPATYAPLRAKNSTFLNQISHNYLKSLEHSVNNAMLRPTKTDHGWGGTNTPSQPIIITFFSKGDIYFYRCRKP